MLEAIDRFDVKQPYRLATYAIWWIRRALQLAVANGAYPVRVDPRHLRVLALSQDRIDWGVNKDGDHSTAATDKTSPRDLIYIQTATRPTVSLNAVRGEPFAQSRVIQDSGDRFVSRLEDQEALDAMMATLSPREHTVLTLRFGLESGKKLPLSEVGKRVGISSERVRQIEDRALEKLRALATGPRPPTS